MTREDGQMLGRAELTFIPLTEAQKAEASAVVANHAIDAADCALLLDALGLLEEEPC